MAPSDISSIEAEDIKGKINHEPRGRMAPSDQVTNT